MLFPALLLTVAAPAAAGASGLFNAGQLLDRCQSGAAADISYCFAYVAGTVDAVRAYETWLNVREFCAPADLTQGDLRRVFVDYMVDKPGFRSGEAASVIVVALKQRFPCATPSAPAARTR